MSDEKQYTERDLILAKRDGARTALFRHSSRSMQNIDALAKDMYPLPKVTRARVGIGPYPYGWQWKFENGVFHFRVSHIKEWERVKVAWAPTPELVKLWADLLANPTEEVQE